MTSRRILDARIHAHQVASKIDKIISSKRDNRSHLRWLEGLVRDGRPIPGTPEWDAETRSMYDDLDRGVTRYRVKQ